MSDSKRRLVRQALRTATREPEPNVDPLTSAVPEMLAEARRRRADAPTTELLDAVVAMARVALPRLASVSAALILVAAAIGFTSEPTAVAETPLEFEQQILNAETDDAMVDALFEAMIGRAEE